MSAEEGLGVIKHIRQTCPNQLVIAYSNADWPLTAQSFFDMADAVLAKTADYLDFKRQVDELLLLRFDSAHYVHRMDALVGPEISDRWKYKRRRDHAIRSGSIREFRGYLESRTDGQTVERAIGLASVATGIAQLCLA